MKTTISILSGPHKGEYDLEHEEDDPVRVGTAFWIESSQYEVLSHLPGHFSLAAEKIKYPRAGFCVLTHEDYSQPRAVDSGSGVAVNTTPFVAIGMEFDSTYSDVEWFGMLLKYGSSREEIADALQRLVDALRSGSGVKGLVQREGSEANRSIYPEAGISGVEYYPK